MNTISYNPFKPTRVKTFDHLLDELVSTPFSDFFGTRFVSGTPSVNIVESDEAYDIEVAAPGLSKDEFNITLENDELIITGKKENSVEDTSTGKFTRREFNYQSFERRFHLSEDLDRASISANYNSGILKIILAKSKETGPSSKTIEIS